MKLKLFHYELPLKHTFRISRGSVNVQSTLIAELEHDGVRGYGEATTSRYYAQTIEGMAAVIVAAKTQIEQLTPDQNDAEWPASAWAQLDADLQRSRFAQCAIDEALWDLFGKLCGKPLYQMWGANPASAPLSDYTIGLDTIEVMQAKLQEFADWPIFKIKLGAENDAEILCAMRSVTQARLRVDANCGWTPESATKLLPLCVENGVEFVEQPFAADAYEAMATLKQSSPLPLVADESCVCENDIALCLRQFHGVNIKLMKCGGLTPARRMIENAKRLGLSTMLGCMTESTIGISALAQLAPLVDAADMDGAVLLSADIAEGVSVERGRAIYSERNGAGVEFLAEQGGAKGREIALPG